MGYVSLDWPLGSCIKSGKLFNLFNLSSHEDVGKKRNAYFPSLHVAYVHRSWVQRVQVVRSGL